MNATAAALLTLMGLTGPDPEKLPAPRELPSQVRPQPQVPLGFYRPNPYDVWQSYAVGRGLQWYPRVIENSQGAFYYYNGEPYEWPYIQPRDRLP